MFLLNAPLQSIEPSALTFFGREYDFYVDTMWLAAEVYHRIAARSSARAQQILEAVLPAVYQKTADKGYEVVMDAYLKSFIDPNDPEEFAAFMVAELEKPDVLLCLSPVYFSLFESFREDSAISRAYCQYFLGSHPPEPFKPIKEAPVFWTKLVDFCFRRFAQTYPRQAQKIFDEIIVKRHPFSSEIALLDLDVKSFLQKAREYPTLEVFCSAAVSVRK